MFKSGFSDLLKRNKNKKNENRGLIGFDPLQEGFQFYSF